MTTEEAKKFGLQLLHGIMERNESYPVYANNVKQAIDALSEESSSSGIPNDLEEAAREYAKEYTKNEGNGGDDWEDDIQITFKAAAEWMKAKMMEKAVDGYVTLTLTGVLTVAATIKEGDNIGIGDKVRVIVIKEGK